MSVSPTSTPAMSVHEKSTRRYRSPDKSFLDGEVATARSMYLKIYLGGTFMIVVLIFGIMSIYWGSLWKVPAHNLSGWVVDFDGGMIGQGVTTLLTTSTTGKVTWHVVPASSFPGGVDEVGAAILEEHAWAAITISQGASDRLLQSLSNPNASYAGSDALTSFGVEARNENAYRNLIRPTIQAQMEAFSRTFANKIAQQASNSSNIGNVLAISPQTITTPVAYKEVNLAPFNIPVATAVTFVGLIYQVILSFFLVMIGTAARDASGFSTILSTRSLIALRFASSFIGYFFLSLVYCLLSVAFKLSFSHKFGHSGFLVFWMLNYVGMLALGLALESLLTLLTVKFIPFFMLTWIITNVSVCVFPIEVLPAFYRYGYAMPFYNISRAMRTIVFGTKNRVGFSFGILIIWITISCITLPLIQWLVRRRPVETPVNLQDEVRTSSQVSIKENVTVA